MEQKIGEEAWVYIKSVYSSDDKHLSDFSKCKSRFECMSYVLVACAAVTILDYISKFHE